VLSQSYTEIEIIVINDGSTDNTEEILAPYRDRVTAILQENGGLSSARNTGIRKARGEFIALLDADDSWVPNKLERQMPRFADPEVGIVTSDFSVRYSDGRFQTSYLINRPLASEGYVFDRYIRSRFLFPSAMVIRRQCFEQCGLFHEEMRAAEDVELFASMCLRWKVAIVPEPLMIRYEGTHNITANGARLGDYMIRALEKILAKEPHLPSSSRAVLNEELGRQHWWKGASKFKECEIAQARYHYWKAMRYDPANVRTCILPLLACSLPATLRNSLMQSRREK